MAVARRWGVRVLFRDAEPVLPALMHLTTVLNWVSHPVSKAMPPAENNDRTRRIKVALACDSQVRRRWARLRTDSKRAVEERLWVHERSRSNQNGTEHARGVKHEAK
jgi:hypothetical protein